MKKLIIRVLTILFISNIGFSQTKNFIDQPYVETSAKVDTLVTPDRIFLTILITEKDTKGKISVEELENNMAEKLKLLGIDLEKQLFLSDLSSNFKKYFLRQQDVLKSKAFSLLVYDAMTAGKIIMELENINISNVLLEKTEYSKIENLKLELKSKAIKKAKLNAISMTSPLNQKIGNAIFISDLGNISNQLQGRVSGLQIRGMSSLNETKFKPIDIEFEKIKVESEVIVKFKLE
ncbi:SIMPL domain-containing protein [Lutibacter sp. B1]|uniref:SIMPL domain-containing protein n=1 Tax=Lutibacter sp. B1 TaxID=2725996 RepID=UPI001456FEF2|nr:SIMPL domain-containing protein [Lutibacter sp. B1]NLP59350.1 SIMPL domain-containing protein [Lutibacter sp. B1]